MKKLFENWRKYTNEQAMEPGSFPVDGAGQSGIPTKNQKMPAPDPEPEPEPEPVEVRIKHRIAMYWSLLATGAWDVYAGQKASIDIHGGNTDITREIKDTITAMREDLDKVKPGWKNTKYSKNWEKIYNEAVRQYKAPTNISPLGQELSAFEHFIDQGMPSENRNFKVLAAYVNAILPNILSVKMSLEKAKQKTKKYLSPFPASSEPMMASPGQRMGADNDNER